MDSDENAIAGPGGRAVGPGGSTNMSVRTMSGLILAGSLSLSLHAQEEPTPRLSWSDFDRDGRVDLFSVDPLGADLFLRNTGEGGFEDVSVALGVAGLRDVRSAAFGDYDGDEWPDLFLVAENGRGRLLRNVEGRQFLDVTSEVGLERAARAEEARWRDFDGDGREDLVLSGPSGDAIFHNDGGLFRAVELPRRRGVQAGDPVVLPALPPLAGLVGVEGSEDGTTSSSPLRAWGSTGPAAPATAPSRTLTAGAGGGTGGAGTGSGSGTGGGTVGGAGGVGPTPGGTQPLFIDPAVPPGFSILGDVDAIAPRGYMKTTETVSVNGDAWFQPNLPAEPGPDDIPDNRLLAGHSVAIDTSGLEKLFVFGGAQTDGNTHQTSGFKFDAEAPRGMVPSVQWAPIAAMPQPARSNMAVVTVDNVIYAIGGADSMLTYGRVDAYEPIADAWTPMTAMTLPFALRGAGAGAVGRRIYVFGGANSTGMPQSALLVFDLDFPGGGWQVLVGSGITPTPRQNAATAVFGGKVYVIGGFDGLSFLDVVEVYDPELNRWERKTPRPTTFQSATITVANGKLLLFGGENPLPIGDVHQYDPIADNWTARDSMITPRSKAVAGRLCKSTYVAGGEEEGPMPMPMPMPVPVNEEYLEAQDDKAVYTKM